MQDKIIKINFNYYLGREVAFRSTGYDKAKIKNEYEKFEKNIENHYASKYEELNLMNPFNYVKGRQYKKSISKNVDDVCFILYYYKGLHEVDGLYSSSLKEDAVNRKLFPKCKAFQL